MWMDGQISTFVSLPHHDIGRYLFQCVQIFSNRPYCVADMDEVFGRFSEVQQR